LPAKIVTIDYQQPAFENNIIKGNIPVLDIQYGNVWTNIDKTTFANLH
jgi:S-adenosylmethionine hydrolase